MAFKPEDSTWGGHLYPGLTHTQNLTFPKMSTLYMAEGRQVINVKQ